MGTGSSCLELAQPQNHMYNGTCIKNNLRNIPNGVVNGTAVNGFVCNALKNCKAASVEGFNGGNNLINSVISLIIFVLLIWFLFAILGQVRID